jgi:UDP-N-acetylglucosamine--N-acetylmuramyl-(pentapeptide) pyrophosphoryl-undecaprenol N-acetylglucosamine transferase
VAYQGMEKFFPKEKILMTGNPVRQDILEVKEKNIEDYHFFNLDINKKTILIIGGSLGARSINQAVSANLHLFIENDIQILWQTGKNSYQNHPQETELLKNPLLKKVEFIYEMNRAYGIADVVISRAGALAVSEISLVKKPAIFVPLPTAAEDHQTQNALALVSQNSAQMVKDTEAYEILAKEAIKLLYDEQKCTIFKNNLSLFAKPNATQEIAKEVIKLVK